MFFFSHDKYLFIVLIYFGTLSMLLNLVFRLYRNRTNTTWVFAVITTIIIYNIICKLLLNSIATDFALCYDYSYKYLLYVVYTISYCIILLLVYMLTGGGWSECVCN